MTYGRMNAGLNGSREIVHVRTRKENTHDHKASGPQWEPVGRPGKGPGFLCATSILTTSLEFEINSPKAAF